MKNIFYLIFALTILTIRAGVFLFPQKKIIIDGTIIHHFWIGAVVVLLVLLLPKKYAKLRTGLFAVGLGAAADELVFMIFGGGTVSDYWSIHSVLGAVVVALMVFVIREKFIKII